MTVTERRDVSGFDSVSLAGLGELTIAQGDEESLTIEAEADVLARVTVEVRDRTLVLGYRPRLAWGRVRRQLILRFELIMKDVHGMALSGAGTINASGIRTDALEVSVSGAGSLSLDSLETEDLSTRISGAGNCTLSGRAVRHEIIISGAGDYRAGKLESEAVAATISGAGSATVWARDSLEASISGTGSIKYHGDPDVTKRVTGVGSITALGGP